MTKTLSIAILYIESEFETFKNSFFPGTNKFILDILQRAKAITNTLNGWNQGSNYLTDYLLLKQDFHKYAAYLNTKQYEDQKYIIALYSFKESIIQSLRSLEKKRSDAQLKNDITEHTRSHCSEAEALCDLINKKRQMLSQLLSLEKELFSTNACSNAIKQFVDEKAFNFIADKLQPPILPTQDEINNEVIAQYKKMKGFVLVCVGKLIKDIDKFLNITSDRKRAQLILSGLKSEIKAVQQNMKEEKEFNCFDSVSLKPFEDYLTRNQKYYDYCTALGGTYIPSSQLYSDPLTGVSDGQCLGYFLKWAKANSPLPLTHVTDEYVLKKQMFSPYTQGARLSFQKNLSREQRSKCIADKMVEIVNANPTLAIGLGLTDHIVGIKKYGEGVTFYDANFGDFFFKDDKSFNLWLSFFLKEMDYCLDQPRISKVAPKNCARYPQMLFDQKQKSESTYHNSFSIPSC